MHHTLEQSLCSDLPTARWFRSKSRRIDNIQVQDVFTLDSGNRDNAYALLIIKVSFQEGSPELYAVPAHLVNKEFRYTSMPDAQFSLALVKCLAEENPFSGQQGSFISELYDNALKNVNLVTPESASLEQSNSSILFPGQYFLKLYRKLEEGIHPEPELGLYLERSRKFPFTPRVIGSWVYVVNGKRYTAGILQEYAHSETDAWNLFTTLLQNDASALHTENAALDSLLQATRRLGQQTAEMHLALGAEGSASDFNAEPFTPAEQKTLLHAVQNQIRAVSEKLKTCQPSWSTDARSLAEQFQQNLPDLFRQLEGISASTDNGQRIRIHGDLHLGQILYTGNNFLFVDFEGEPARSLAERRIKHTPLRDVAGMVRSFDYAAAYCIRTHPGLADAAFAVNRLRDAVRRLTHEYLDAYFQTMGNSPLLPSGREGRMQWLRVCVLQKALYEVGYEMENRPDWLAIPLAYLITG